MSANTIIRAARNSENPYAQISRAIFEDERISWRAKGVIGYLLSRKDGWQVMVGDLQKRSTDGRDACYKALDELGAAGYLERHERREKGRIKGYEYVIHEVWSEARAASWKAVSGKAVSGKAVSGETVSGNSDTSNKGSKQELNPATTEAREPAGAREADPTLAARTESDQETQTVSGAVRAGAADAAQPGPQASSASDSADQDGQTRRPTAPEEVPGGGARPVDNPVDNSPEPPGVRAVRSMFGERMVAELLAEAPERARWAELPTDELDRLRRKALAEQTPKTRWRTLLIGFLDVAAAQLDRPKTSTLFDQRRAADDAVNAILSGARR